MDKVLVVDDNKQHCELLKDVLLSWGYEAHTALQGLEALDLARRLLPDLILLDVMLPGMNGFEVCQTLREDPATRHIPVVMQTVLDESGDRIRGYKAGANIFITKPINYGELRHHLECLIQHKKEWENHEARHAVVRCLVNILESLAPDLYRHSAQVFSYCNKAANLLGMDAERKARFSIAALLYDLRKLTEEGTDRGKDIFKDLKMNEWLGVYLAGPPARDDGNCPEDVWLLAAIREFELFLDQHKDPEQAFAVFQRQSNQSYPATVITTLHQVIKDDLFLKTMAPSIGSP